MPCEEHIRVPVAQNCGGSNFGVNGAGAKIFEKLASEPDRDHKIDSVVGFLVSLLRPKNLAQNPAVPRSGEEWGQASSSDHDVTVALRASARNSAK